MQSQHHLCQYHHQFHQRQKYHTQHDAHQHHHLFQLEVATGVHQQCVCAHHKLNGNVYVQLQSIGQFLLKSIHQQLTKSHVVFITGTPSQQKHTTQVGHTVNVHKLYTLAHR